MSFIHSNRHIRLTIIPLAILGIAGCVSSDMGDLEKLVAEIMSKTNQPLSELVSKRMQQYPISGEINIKVHRPEKLLEEIKNRYQNQSVSVDDIDGYSFDFESWRFNLRMSNTEPLVRLNVETKADEKLLNRKTDEILDLIETLQG